MSGQDNEHNQPHVEDRRDILRDMGAASAVIGLTPVLPTNVLAQSKTADLPRSMEEAGKRFRDHSLGITELTQSYLKGAKELGPKLDPFITVTEEEALKTAAILDSELAEGKVSSPLHGILIVYKDNTATEGTLSQHSSRIFVVP